MALNLHSISMVLPTRRSPVANSSGRYPLVASGKSKNHKTVANAQTTNRRPSFSTHLAGHPLYSMKRCQCCMGALKQIEQKCLEPKWRRRPFSRMISCGAPRAGLPRTLPKRCVPANSVN
eukprot:7950806-Pyramimonas_sp.AAC.1